MTTPLGNSARKGSYGIDAPMAPLWLIIGGILLLAGGVGLLGIALWASIILFLAGLFMLISAASYLYSTRAGKFAVWQRLLDQLELRGDEQALDAGCGRGAVLTAIARRLPDGRVTGVDLWRAVDQSGNKESATMRNAEADGVGDRVELVTSDLRELPWAEPRFDVLVSALVFHNIKPRAERDRAVTEAARMVKPGGRLVIADIAHTEEYVEALSAAGWSDVLVSDPGWRYWFGPFVRTKVVTAHIRA